MNSSRSLLVLGVTGQVGTLVAQRVARPRPLSNGGAKWYGAAQGRLSRPNPRRRQPAARTGRADLDPHAAARASRSRTPKCSSTSRHGRTAPLAPIPGGASNPAWPDTASGLAATGNAGAQLNWPERALTAPSLRAKRAEVSVGAGVTRGSSPSATCNPGLTFGTEPGWTASTATARGAATHADPRAGFLRPGLNAEWMRTGDKRNARLVWVSPAN